MGANLSARQLNSSEKHFTYSNAPSPSAVTCGVASALRRAVAEIWQLPRCQISA